MKSTLAEDDHAIVIGIRTYPRMRSLQGPCNDAEAFRGWLADPTKGNVPQDNIKMLITDDFADPNATYHPFTSEIDEQFYDFVTRGRAAAAGPPLGRRLYIFMAGHGFSERGGMTAAALYAANAEPSFAPHVAATAYARWFQYNAVFDEIVLVADFCRTTNPSSRITSPPLPDTTGSPRSHKVRTFFAYAVPDGQAAREHQVNGKWQGIFTSALLDAFDHAIPNQAGFVRGRQVSNYIHQAVGAIQTPDIDVNRRDIVFAERHQANAVEVSICLDPFVGGETVTIQDHQQEEVVSTSPASASFQLQLTAGLYKAVLPGEDRKTLFEVPSDVEITI